MFQTSRRPAKRQRPKLGIDVGARYHDIRRIVLKYFRVAGVHPDDLVQDVACRLLEQNKLPCAYDPARGAFSTYVFRVASNRAALLARKERTQARVRGALLEELQRRNPLHGASVESLVIAYSTLGRDN